MIKSDPKKRLLKKFNEGKLINPKTKKKMTKAQFKKNLRGIASEKWIKANVK